MGVVVGARFFVAGPPQNDMLGEWEGTRGEGYWAVKPPSMTSSLPVMKDDSSEARKRAP